MQGTLLLDIVVREGTSVLELLAREDQSLLVRWNALLILDLTLDIVDGVGTLYLQCDCLASQCFHKDLHSTAQPEHQMQGALLLNVVVGQGAAVLELFPGKDQSLLVRWNSFLILDLGLNIVNSVRGLDFQGDGFASEGLDEDLHSTAETEDKVQSRLLLDVVVRERSAVF